MRRTALSLAAVFITAAAYLYLYNSSGVLLLSVGFLLLGLAVAAVGHSRFSVLKPIAVLTVGAIFSLYLAFGVQSQVDRAEALINTEQTVTVRVIDEPVEYSSSVSVLTETESFGGMRFKFSIYTENSEISVSEGDILRVDLEISKLGRNYKSYNYPDRVFVSARCKNAEVIGHRESLYTRCIALRRSIRAVIEKFTEDDTAALLEGVLLGDISLMSDELYDDFKITGVAHITAVSGMHIGALCVMLTSVFSRFLGRRKAALLAMLPMVLVVMLAGFTPSAVRSGIMCFIMLSAQCLLKKADGLNSLGVAVAAMLCYNPFYVCSLSFQLSCSAAAGVILISPMSGAVSNRIFPFEIKLVSYVLRQTVKLFIQSVGAVLCTLPFQITEFGYISLVAPIANILICAASVYMMVLTVVGVLTYLLPFLSALTGIMFLMAELLAQYITVTVGVLSEIPFSYIPFGSYEAVIWVTLSATLIAVWLLLGKPGRTRMIALLCVALLLVTLWADCIASNGVVEVAVLSVGNGFCTVISCENKCIVIGCGDGYEDGYVLTEHLRERGITRTELLLIPSTADTCFKGYGYLKSSVKFGAVAVSESFDTSELKGAENIRLVKSGETFTALDGRLSVKLISADSSSVYEISVFNKRFAVGCCGYDSEAIGLKSVDFVITGRALPKTERCEFAIVSAEAGEYCVASAERTLVTGNRTVSVKLKNKKGMTVYAR